MGMVDYKRTTIRQVGDQWAVLYGVGRQKNFPTLEAAKADIDKEMKYSSEEMQKPGFAMSEKEKKKRGITNAFQNGQARAEEYIRQRMGNGPMGKPTNWALPYQDGYFHGANGGSKDKKIPAHWDRADWERGYEKGKATRQS